MKEDFLHYLWKHSLYSKPLRLNDGSKVEVLLAGDTNSDSGPDFFNAKIKIGETIWAGNVEIHVNASDWNRHNHQNDTAYDNIILHAVANPDIEIKRSNGATIPAVQIEAPAELYEQYLYLMQNTDWVPCESFIKKVDGFTVLQWKEALLVERLEDRAKIITERYLATNKNLEETFYQTLAGNFGFKTNSLPFVMLSQSIPLKYLGKHKDQVTLIEALLFGQAGLLPGESSNDYVMQLKREYSHLRNKFALAPLSGHLWKFAKLRPPNFPTIRLAQFAALIHKSNALMSKIVEAETFDDIRSFFDIEASAYWQNHYVFGKQSGFSKKAFGDMAFQNIVINTVAPFFAWYGKQKGKPELSNRAIEWLMHLKPEQNKITKHWQRLGLNADNAFDTQSLIQLKNLYCNKKRCLHCRIGNQVILHRVCP